MSKYAVKSKITKCIDDTGYPSFVECEFVDASGTVHQFQEKDVILTVETLDRNSNYPQDAFVDCEIIERRYENGRNIVKVDTERPCGIESTNGKTVFEVFEDQIVEN
jgi:hypothetical protein